MAAETVHIRRYPNRRLYDRSRRRYVTLQDLETLVREGRTVEVRDARTGEDLTRQVLAQILLERHPDRMALFPVAMLHSLLQANDLVLDFWRGCLRQSLVALETWQQHQHPPDPLANPVAWMSALFPFAPHRPATPESDPPDPDPDPDLAHRLSALEARLRHLESGATDDAPTPPPKRRRKP